MANISETSINRPVLSTVMMLVILLFGFIGYRFLGVREFPSVDQPIISVNVSYPGANADVIMNQITEPLEQNINGIPGIRSLSSVSSQGSSRITVEFEFVRGYWRRRRTMYVIRYLVPNATFPVDCDPPTVSKADADASPIMQIAIRSNKRSLMELSEIAELTVKERLQTIENVSGVDIWGQKRYSMRLWLDPIKMAGYGVTPMDVKNAVDNENVELPSGSIEGNTISLSIRTLGLMHTAKEFNDLIIKEDNNNIVRFSDVGRAEVAPEDLRSLLKKNGEPMVMTVIIPQPGANHIEIADEAYKRIEQLQKDLPEDVTIEMMYDNTRFIRASIGEVQQTIYEAFLLVVLIIFLFLRDWRVTLVPVVVIPVSLVGAFFVMYISGFSVNVLTMLAVVLSVGLVVDDAIVVAENIYVRIEQGMSPKEAGIEGYDLMRLFGSERLMKIFTSLGVAENEQIEHKMLSNAIEKAQEKIEFNNFGIRKNLLDYDQVNNEQREIIYKERRQVLDGENMREAIYKMIQDTVDTYVDMCFSDDVDSEEWDLNEFNGVLTPIIPIRPLTAESVKGKKRDEIRHELKEEAVKLYEEKEAEFPEPEQLRELERVVLLKCIDSKWMDHIDDMEILRQGIGLAAYGQRDPVVEYKMSAFDMFNEMITSIQEDTLRMLYHVHVEQKIEREQVAKVTGTNKDDSAGPKKPVQRKEIKVYPNDPCPCGSGKKYKQCCGRKNKA